MALADLPAPAHDDDDFEARLRLPVPPRDNDVAWEPRASHGAQLVRIHDTTPDDVTELRNTVAELTARVESLTDLVDELRDTLLGLQEDFPPARWRLPLQPTERT